MINSENDLRVSKYGISWESVLSSDEIEIIHEIADGFKGITGESGKIMNANLENTEIRRSFVIWLENNQNTHWLYKKITDAVLRINAERYQFELLGAQPIQYTVYEEYNRGEYSWHNDIVPFTDHSVRKLSVSILLSDTSEFEGGSFLFSPDGEHIEIEQHKGRMIVFPSWIPHCVTPILKGKRISLVMWLYGKNFR